MKRLIILSLLLFNMSGCATAATVPTPEHTDPVLQIPNGIIVRSDIPVLFTICGKNRALTLWSPKGVKVFIDGGMTTEINKLFKNSGTRGLPMVRVELNDDCDVIKNHDFGGEDNKGEPTWSANYQP